MKRFILLSSVLSILLLSIAQSCTSKPEEGIQFFEGSWQEALQKAKAENKPIFLDIYASWCGPCKLLKKRTFTDKDVAAYFNAHFINVSLDGEKGDGAQLANKYQIQGYPTLMIIDANENVLVYTMGYYKANELLQIGQSAFTKGKRR
ncbi:MAG TPA: thioredoxin family protein [Flavipsychrobacter sp.]|nr:thioredoxin family protein [Flavipsychrobacter sp.]